MAQGSRISVVAVAPKYAGNVGAIARAMKNFDVKDLVLVAPCKIDDEAYQRAMHSKDILDNARTFDNIEDALEEFDYKVGTSKETAHQDKKHHRKAVTPADLFSHLEKVEGKIALIFGREDYGLYNEELRLCDILVSVPTSDGHPVMNLSHAVAVVLYELFKNKAFLWRPPPSSDFERRNLEGIFSQYLDSIGWPIHKREKTSLMLKRIIGRADVSKWEFHTLMGVFHQAIKEIDRLERDGHPTSKKDES